MNVPRRAVPAVLALLLLPAGAARADGVKVEPGLWEMTSTFSHPMSQVPQTRVTRECIRDGELKPDFFQDEASPCQVVSSEVRGDTMHWRLECRTPEGGMDGVGELTAAGRSLRGSMTLTMQTGGQRMEMKHRWEGRHLGPCP